MGEIINGMSLNQFGFNEINGVLVTKQIDLGGTGAQSVNIFKVTKSVLLLSLRAMISEANTLTNATAVHFDLWDGTSSIDLTLNDGVLSGMGVGTFLVKSDLMSATVNIMDPVAASALDGPYGVGSYTQVFATQKTGVNTYIRFNYTTTDAPIDAKLVVQARFRPVTLGVMVGDLTPV